MGADSAIAANVITLPATDGNTFHVTSADSTCNLITSTGWAAGSQINLVFDSTSTVVHNSAAVGTDYPIILSGGNTVYTKANDVMSLLLDSSSRWLETGYISSGTTPTDSTCTALFDTTGGKIQWNSASDRTSTVYYKYEAAADPTNPSMVTLSINKKYALPPGTSLATAMITTNAPLPAAIRPSVALTIPIQVYMGTEGHDGCIRILTDGNFDFAVTTTSDYPTAGNGTKYVYTSWAASTAQKGWDAFSVRYPIWP
jgi:hypothetical protein